MSADIGSVSSLNYDLDLKSWKPLDNAAKLFPAIIRKNNSTFFRLELSLNDFVYANALQNALGDTLKRYPLFQVRLRRGFFWHFLEDWKHDPIVLPLENEEPCKYIRLVGFQKNALWRVFAGGKTIVLEVSHLLTDGKGALEFLRTLLCQYYEYAYKKINDWEDVKQVQEKSSLAENEESYCVYYEKEKLKFKKEKESFHYPEKREAFYMLSRLLVNLVQLKTLAKKNKVSITSVLVAVHLYAVYKLYKKKITSKQVVRQMIPVNLRQFFKSQTMRNFYYCIMLEIDFYAKEYDFDKIMKHIHQQLQKELDVKNIHKNFSAYVDVEKQVYNKIVPRFLKTCVLRVVQSFVGDKKMIGSFSNLGFVKFPEEVEKLVTNISFFPMPSKKIGRNITVVSCKNTLCIGIGKYIKNANVEKEMTKILLEKNIDVVYLER